MRKQGNNLTSSKIQELVNSVTLKSKEKNVIKSLKEAFKDIPTMEEIHRGKKNTLMIK